MHPGESLAFAVIGANVQELEGRHGGGVGRGSLGGALAGVRKPTWLLRLRDCVGGKFCRKPLPESPRAGVSSTQVTSGLTEDSGAGARWARLGTRARGRTVSFSGSFSRFGFASRSLKQIISDRSH